MGCEISGYRFLTFSFYLWGFRGLLYLHSHQGLTTQAKLQMGLKVGSHDPIFAANYSLVHFFRQQLDVWTPISDKFPVVFVYWMKIEHVLFSSN